MGKPLSDSIFLDKLLDLILMFLGLYAAMALQDLVDHHKDRAQYVELLRGFKEELNSNRDQRQVIESKLGAIAEPKQIGEAGASFKFFTEQTQYMDRFLTCYTSLRLKGTKQGPKLGAKEQRECAALLRNGFKKTAPEHLDLAPVYRRDMWRLYIADGVQLLREFEKPSNRPRCMIEGKPSHRLAICVGSIYSELDEIERQVEAIQRLVNDTYFYRQGVLDAEFKHFKRELGALGKRKDAEAARQIKQESTSLRAKLYEGQQAVDISLSLMRFKIRQLKVTASQLDKHISEVLDTLNREVGDE